VRAHDGQPDGRAGSDSSGLRSLLELEHVASEHSCAFLLLDPQPAVRRVLEITALLDHFRIGP
jgi:anti-anti-sigma factor